MAKATAKKVVVPKSTVEIIDCEQNSPEWFAARLGLITASHFHKVMAGGDGKVRLRYMHELAGELMTGIPAEAFVNEAMRRGTAQEPEAADEYARQNFVKLVRVGFVKNSGLMKYTTVGCSPDYLIDDDGGLEIKSTIPALLFPRFDKPATLPPEHRAQIHGCMWVCERKWWDIKLYYGKAPGYPGMPDYTVRVQRNDDYINNEIRPAVETFGYELKKLVEQAKAKRKGEG